MNLKNDEKIFLFDLDGTLVDSMPVAVGIVLSLLDEKGIVYQKDIVKTLTPLGFYGISKYYAESLGVPMTAEEIYRWFIEKLRVAYEKEILLKSTVKETLFALKERGARMCVLTGSPHSFADPCLKRNGVYSLFEKVWTTEDFSLLKSDARIYAEAAKRLGVDEKYFVVVDDGLNVLKTAREAGISTIGAYDSYSASEEELSQSADRWVYALAEIL